MKYPELLTFDSIAPSIDEFDCIIDVRSPDEYAQDHIPGAINLPVLDNQERILIGTMYKQQGSFEAKKLGAALVARNVAHHIEQNFLQHPRDWRPLVYCWRGGNRSGAMAHILARIGWPVSQIDGGYKDYRQYVNLALNDLPKKFTYSVLCGPTGAGKSRLLQTLDSMGAQVLDLEQLAAHRGSVLGHIPDQPQPTQRWFESAMWERLRKFSPERPIFIESESKKVGNLRVPDALMASMRASSCIAVSLGTSERVKLLMHDYAHFTNDRNSLCAQLDCLTQLYGRAQIEQWKLMTLADNLSQFVGELLQKHYDPAYARSIERNFPQYSNALNIEIPEFSTSAFEQAARLILSTHSS